MPKEPIGLSRILYYAAAVLFFAAVFLLLLSANMRKELSHDEHMYVAGGYLLARRLLIPYADLPYLQMPNLAFAYASILLGTSHLLLAARLFNTVCATLSAVILFAVTASLFREAGYAARLTLGAGSALLLVANPIFLYSSGLAWNHDLPVLLALLAVAAISSAAGRANPYLLLGAAGVAVGLAVGTRLAFAPALLPLAAGAFFLPGATSPRRRLYRAGAFCLGVLGGLLPAIVVAALAPDRFSFDNLGYHRLSETYWRQLGNTRAMDLPSKLGYLWDVVREPGTLALAIGALLVAILAVITGRAKPAVYFPLALAAGVALSLLVGALLPTPTWYQYYYAPLPFLVLAAAYTAAILYARARTSRGRTALLAAFAVLVLAAGIPAIASYARLNPSLRVDDWVPSQVHALGEEIGQAVGRGKVLTLAPLFPLEGGAGIYEQMAAGPFTWRVAGQLPSEDRGRLGVVGGDDLEALLERDPPAGILTGFEGGLEEPLVKYAQAHGYTARQLSNGATLWLAKPGQP
ncbi:MAG: hypothetical protein ACJ78Q_10675 [Chloroflexia bacterium]